MVNPEGLPTSLASTPMGYVHQSLEPFLRQRLDWVVDEKKLVYPLAKTTEEINMSIASLLDDLRKSKKFKILDGWRDELYAVYHPYHRGIAMERSGTALFGVNTFGVHMTVYTYEAKELRIWVPRRARTKQTYPGTLDNSVAGGLSIGEKALDCIVREADEEASLPAQLVRSAAKPCGVVSYFLIRDKAAGGERGLLQPECQYVYDLEVDSDVTLRPKDNEVDEFYLWTVPEVQQALAHGDFKPNCALVLLDFFIRHGVIQPDNEPAYTEIVSRLHRRLPFPGPECA